MPEHQRLAKAFEKLVKKGVSAVLSNSATPETRALYKRFKSSDVHVRRPINSVASRRGAVAELLVVSK
jgi:site-specific DNA-adenine methylase